MTNTVKKTFKLHPDQFEIVEAALKLCKQKSGTKFDTVALEYIVQEFMGTGMNFPTLRAAMIAERKKAGTYEDFLGVLAGLVDEIGEPEGYATTISFEPVAKCPNVCPKPVQTVVLDSPSDKKMPIIQHPKKKMTP